MNNWITNYAALYADDLKTRQMYLNIGAVVAPIGVTRWSTIGGRSIPLALVEYVDSKGVHRGYVYERYLEPLRYTLPRDVIQLSTATPNQQDAGQYVLYNGTTQYNLCGPLSVCYCAGWKTDITDFLEQWRTEKPSAWKRIFSAGAGRGTDLGDLDAMFAAFEGYPEQLPRLSVALNDPLKGGPLVTPGRIGELLAKNRIIISCKIDSITGRLRGQGVLHWVVLETIMPEGAGALVHLYNPFTNSIEVYTWSELLNSIGQPYGVVVER